jgi:large subunit ribosomal protein L36
MCEQRLDVVLVLVLEVDPDVRETRSGRRMRRRVGIPSRRRPLACLGAEEATMKVRNSLKSLKNKAGSVVVRRHGRTVIVNKRHPRWKTRQG